MYPINFLFQTRSRTVTKCHTLTVTFPHQGSKHTMNYENVVEVFMLHIFDLPTVPKISNITIRGDMETRRKKYSEFELSSTFS